MMMVMGTGLESSEQIRQSVSRFPGAKPHSRPWGSKDMAISTTFTGIDMVPERIRGLVDATRAVAYLQTLGKIVYYYTEILIKFSYGIRTSAFQAIHAHNMKQLNLSIIRINQQDP